MPFIILALTDKSNTHLDPRGGAFSRNAYERKSDLITSKETLKYLPEFGLYAPMQEVKPSKPICPN